MLGRMVVAHLIFKETDTSFSRIAIPFFIPISKAFSFSASLSAFYGVTMFYFSHSDRCIGTSGFTGKEEAGKTARWWDLVLIFLKVEVTSVFLWGEVEEPVERRSWKIQEQERGRLVNHASRCKGRTTNQECSWRIGFEP